jgi:diguanylate cyclase (GGDEF)-like protein
VLVIDDSKFVRKTFTSILSASFAVREEADGEAGWEAIQTDPSIVMVFTDLDMPKLDGFALLGRIRGSSDPRIRDLPVVAISGNRDEANKRRAASAGANDFIAKSADAAEVLSRIQNLLRLISTSRELEASQQALTQSVTHDPVTGTLTPHYLVTEGRKHFSHARRHGGQLSVMAFRIDSYGDLANRVGKENAEQLLARIANMVTPTLRAEDSFSRTAEATFTIVAAGTGAPQMLAFARRLRGQLEAAQVTWHGQPFRITSSFGAASLSIDTVNSIEDLMRVALQRMQAAGRQAEPIVAAEEVRPSRLATLPGDIERALLVLEQTDPRPLGDVAGDVAKRLLRIIDLFRGRKPG